MLIVLGAVVVVMAVLCALFVLALGRASGQMRKSDREALVLAELARQRSPSGAPFFPTDDSAMELVAALQSDADDRAASASSGPRNRRV